jgi:hypothetical protein
VDIIECNGDSCITIVIDFQHSGTGGIGFDVFDRHGFIGFYRYSSLPLTIDCYPISGLDFEYIKVCDNDNPHCCAEKEFEAIDCSEDCDIRDLIAKPFDCTDVDSFYLEIDFIHEHECDDEFYVFVNTHLEGPYRYDNLPIHTGPYKGGCDTRFEIIVADSSCFDCADTAVIEDPCCKDGCELFDLELHILDCDTNDQFAIIIDFEGINTSDSFYIKGNGRNIGPLPYTGLPYTLGHLKGDCDTEYELVIVDSKDDDCKLVKEIGKICCGDTCRIYDLKVDAIECNGDSCIVIKIDFEHTGTAGVGFDVFDRSQHIGFYKYDQLPLTIDCYPISGLDFEFVKICDNDNPHCCTAFEFPALDCGEECKIFEVVAEPTECDSNNTFSIELDFDHMHTSDSFYVERRGMQYGPFAYADLPIKFGHFEGDCRTEYEFIIVDTENADCRKVFEIGKVCCDNCEITELRFDRTECDSNGLFFLVINFDHKNASDSFEVRGNGHHYGTFAYSALPVQIGPLEGDCRTEYEIVVIDSEDAHCTAEIGIGKVCCDECDIFNLELSATDCDTNGMFLVELNFDYQLTSDSFYVRGNGRNEGPFSYNNLPIVLGPYLGDCTTEYVFAIVDAENEDCREVKVLGKKCCGDCEIENLRAEAIRCNGDTCIQVILDFSHSGTGSQFNVFDRNMLVGTYDYSELPFLTIDCYPISGKDFEFLKVCDVDRTECCAEVEFPALDCETISNEDILKYGWHVYYDFHTRVLKLENETVNPTELEIEIISISGLSSLHHRAFASDQLNLSHLNNGVYVVRLTSGTASSYLKLVKS